MTIDEVNKECDRRERIGGTIMAVVWVILLVIGLCLHSCKTQSISCSHENDSIVTKTEYKWDSVYIDRYHTIFQKGDTIYKTDSIFIDRWHKAEKADTVYIDKTETIIQPQPYIPDYNKNCTRGFWVLLAILILLVGCWALRKYLKLRTGGLIK